MGIPESPNGDSFFTATQNQPGAALSSRQIDVAQPNVVGLTTVTDPLVPSRYIPARLRNFDPEVYDLRDSSHLMRLLRALMGAAGVGGYQRQLMINRMGSSLAGTHFLDLDAFWGALFTLPRLPREQYDDGVDPMQGTADADTWDAVHSRDASYRNRLNALARAFSYNGTYTGVQQAAEALLDCEVDLLESWTFADALQGSGNVFGNTYFQVASFAPTWGALQGETWGELQGGISQVAASGRSEIVLQPRRTLTEDERWQALQVLQRLKPAGSVVTLLNGDAYGLSNVAPRSLWSDSTDWFVISQINPLSNLVQPVGPVYQNAAPDEATRPAFGRYTGERWSYNSRIATVTGYALVDGEQEPGSNYQTVDFLDGTSQDYVPSDGLLDARQAMYSRLASEGVQTTYPYAAVR